MTLPISVQVLDEKAKEAAAREGEVARLEREVKSLLQAEKQQSDVNGEIKAEVGGGGGGDAD